MAFIPEEDNVCELVPRCRYKYYTTN